MNADLGSTEMPGSSADLNPCLQFRLDGSHALITGASRGIGRSFAWTLARAGASVTLAARQQETLDVLAAEMHAQRLKCQTVCMDVTDEDSIDHAFWRTAQSAFGPADIIVNNAGISTSRPALQQSTSDWDNVMATNLRGPWLVAQAAARTLIERGRGGAIINVGSILGIRVAAAVVPYATSKAGLLHLTRGLALEWARYDIRVNALLPGYIATELNSEFLDSNQGQRLLGRVPSRRFSTASDLDGALLLLSSRAGRQISGAQIAVDGGHLVSSL